MGRIRRMRLFGEVNMHLPVAIWLLWLFGIPCIAGTYYFYDRAVRLIHDLHPELWTELGRPVGFLWSPAGWRTALLSRHPLFWQITFRSPSWSNASAGLASALRWYRLSYWGFCAVVVTVACIQLTEDL